MTADTLTRTLASYEAHAAAYAARSQAEDLARGWSSFIRSLLPPACLLDLGCGAGRDLAYFRNRGYRVVGLDRSAGLLAQAAAYVPGVPLTLGDARTLPFRSGAFDGVWACASLLHLPREALPTALAEVRRVLRGGGVFYAALKAGSGTDSNDTFGERFFTLYQPPELVLLLDAAGFSLRELWLETAGTVTWINTLAV